MSKSKTPPGYEQKFAELIRSLKEQEAEIMIIHNPNVLGDDYDELIESLNRIADAEKKLVILPRKDRGKPDMGNKG